MKKLKRRPTKPSFDTLADMVARGGFEPPLTPSEGYGFRDRCTNHYTTGQYLSHCYIFY